MAKCSDLKISSKPFLPLLYCREIGATGSAYRLTCRMLRSLFESRHRVYGRRTWQQPKQKYSTAPWFVEEASRLLVNSRQTCLSTIHPRQPLFDVDTFVSRSSVVLDVMYCESPLISVNCLLKPDGECCEENGFFLFLFKHSFLELRSPNGGRLIQRLFLSNSPLSKMHEMNWNVPQESFVVASANNPKRPNTTDGGRVASKEMNDIVVSLMVFKVFPLKIECHLQIRRSIFGVDVMTAEVHHDLLLVMHSGKSTIRLYSLKHLRTKDYSEFRPLTLGERDAETMLVVGTYPDGIPVNVDVTTAPPLLYEVSSHGHHLELAVAGYDINRSLLCLVSPVRAPFQFNVVDAIKRKTLKDGVFEDNDTAAVMPHRLFTHPDDSSRLIYISGSKVVVYECFEEEGNQILGQSDRKLTVHFSFDAAEKQTKSSTASSPVTRTSPPSPFISSRARIVKQRELYGSPLLRDSTDSIDGEHSATVISVSYCAEMELLVLLVTAHNGDLDRVVFLDNFTGSLVKTVTLPLPIASSRARNDIDPMSSYEQYIGLTFDTLVHCRREPERHSSRWTCAIYSNIFSSDIRRHKKYA